MKNTVRKYAHDQLVNIARKWLTKKCAVVVTELAATMEHADALGFRGDGLSMLVECKASKADFLADKNKFFRRNPEMGIGAMRYFLAPQGLIDESELPDGWGLLEWTGRKVVLIKESSFFEERRHAGEKSILISVLRRLHGHKPEGISIKTYSYGLREVKNKATVGVERDSLMVLDLKLPDPMALSTYVRNANAGVPIPRVDAYSTKTVK